MSGNISTAQLKTWLAKGEIKRVVEILQEASLKLDDKNLAHEIILLSQGLSDFFKEIDAGTLYRDDREVKKKKLYSSCLGIIEKLPEQLEGISIIPDAHKIEKRPTNKYWRILLIIVGFGMLLFWVHYYTTGSPSPEASSDPIKQNTTDVPSNTLGTPEQTPIPSAPPRMSVPDSFAITGMVLDSATNEKLPGVVITTGQGAKTISDENGRYAINIVDTPSNRTRGIRFSFSKEGYMTTEDYCHFNQNPCTINLAKNE